jgi:general secretion pathway protein G
MRSRFVNRARRAFTLIEILIVVVILGILAAIVIPQFTDASEEAGASSVRSQLQTVRSQVELYRVQHTGTLPDFATNDWDDLINEDYLQQAPRNPLVQDALGNPSSTLEVADKGPGDAAAANAGWVWNDTTDDMYGVDKDGNVMDW